MNKALYLIPLGLLFTACAPRAAVINTCEGETRGRKERGRFEEAGKTAAEKANRLTLDEQLDLIRGDISLLKIYDAELRRIK